LIEFLVESIVLCLVGGSIGLLFVYGTTQLATYLFEMELILSFANIVLGMIVSVAIGIVSGFIPAWTASRLDPVEAIRAK